MKLLQFVFWIALFGIFYAYFGYTCLLWLIALNKKGFIVKKNITPSVSLVISVYNEENIIVKRIENALQLDYPIDLLEIAIISDGSTDRTNAIINKYAEQDKRICSCIVPTNKGKAMCLNDYIPKLRGKIILFSDANSFYDKNLIRKIIRSFADERIGFVTGITKYFTTVRSKITETTNLYTKLEKLTKSLESKICSCVGADGAVFAIRKALFSQMKPYDINDLVIPLMIVKKGYRGILEESAVCNEETALTVQMEFRRQVRITNRTIRAIFNHKELLNPFYHTIFAFELFSHKIMKLITPFLIIIIFVTNCILMPYSDFYAPMFVTQLFFYFLAYLGYRDEKKKNMRTLTSMAFTFILINLAMLKGWFTYFLGKTYSTWSPERT